MHNLYAILAKFFCIAISTLQFLDKYFITTLNIPKFAPTKFLVKNNLSKYLWTKKEFIPLVTARQKVRPT